ncbi:MAG: hypothetical protein HY376_02865 [Candidatus Blackburnbacteria bacterium]|nr:hypothetical protein [Candidatus Blackburnbacteria bacterium]
MRIFDMNIPDWVIWLPFAAWLYLNYFNPSSTSLFGFGNATATSNTAATENDAATTIAEKQIHADSGSFKFSETEQEAQKGSGMAFAILILIVVGIWLGSEALLSRWNRKRIARQEEVEQLRKERDELQAKMAKVRK